jgi:glycine cleavage system transcriptional repressor
MAHFAVSVFGRDRPGIVAAVARLLLEHGVNVEDSRMANLRGHFAMMLLVAAPEGAGEAGLRAGLEELREREGLEAVALSAVAEVPAAHAEPSYVVSVYGADHPGIVAAVAGALAARDVNITDLETRLLGEGLYVMLLEVALPAGMSGEAVVDALAAVGTEQGVEVSVRPLEADAL